MDGGVIVVFVLLCLAAVWIKFAESREKCPNCKKRNRRNAGNRTSLEKEVRHKDVTRQVKGADGKVLNTYKERVAVNYAHNHYDLRCKRCDHQWAVQKWEEY